MIWERKEAGKHMFISPLPPASLHRDSDFLGSSYSQQEG